MKYTFALLALFAVFFVGFTNASPCEGLKAQQTVDCIIQNASDDMDKGQSASEENYHDVMPATMENSVAEASNAAAVDQQHSNGGVLK